MKIILAILVSMLLTGSAWADTRPPKSEDVTGNPIYKMCDVQVNGEEGVCTVGGVQTGDEYVLNASGYKSLTFFSMQSDSATYSCDIYTRDESHDAGPVAGNGFKVNVTSLSETQEALTLSGPFNYVWVNCTAIAAGGGVTITVLAQSK